MKRAHCVSKDCYYGWDKENPVHYHPKSGMKNIMWNQIVCPHCKKKNVRHKLNKLKN